MAVIVHQKFSQLFTDYVLGGSGTITPPGTWYMGLTTIAVGTQARNSIISATVSGSNINEIGVTPQGYARTTIARSIAQGATDWGTSTFDNTLSTGGQSTTADQVTFGTFTGAPTPNGANAWFLSDVSTVNGGVAYCSGDTAATRTFANGDTEKVTATVKAG